MKKTMRLLALLLALTVLLCACAQKPEKKILGKWMDSTGSHGYEFLEEGRVKVTFYQFKIEKGGLFSFLSGLIGIGSSLLDGTYDGSYTMDSENETITITYTIYRQTKSYTYSYVFQNNDLVLTDKENNKSVTLYLQTETDTTTTNSAN